MKFLVRAVTLQLLMIANLTAAYDRIRRGLLMMDE